MKKKSFNVLLVPNIHPSADQVFGQKDFFVEKLKVPPSTLKLFVSALKNMHVLCVRSVTCVSKEILLQSVLDCIGAFCIGVNNIDLKTACKQGVPVFNAPYSNTRSVAEMVMGLMICLSRKMFTHFTNMHQGKWDKFSKDCFELRGKILGIIGYGHIGSQVSVLAESFGMQVIYYDILSKLPIGNAKPVFSLRDLLRQADFVSLHVPETKETKNFISYKEIACMKSLSYLVNTSRGSVLDISAVNKALDMGKLAGVAIDVFPEEPQSSKSDFKFPLQKKNSVILSPHVGGSTEEAQIAIVKEVCKSIKNFLFTGSTQGAVNFPSLFVPPLLPKTARIINIHINQPGVLGQINKLVSKSRANIKTQYLATNKWIGYLVMDLEKQNVRQIGQKIAGLETSIKTRVIS